MGLAATLVLFQCALSSELQRSLLLDTTNVTGDLGWDAHWYFLSHARLHIG